MTCVLDSEDNFQSRYWNVSQHRQSFVSLISSGRLNSMQVCTFCVQTIFYNSFLISILLIFQHEYTFLLYLTPDWEVNNYGETVFFEELFNKDGRPFPPGKQQYEWLASVRPRYGRIVIFRGIIPHSARPPNPGFNGVRYTFACKVSWKEKKKQTNKGSHCDFCNFVECYLEAPANELRFIFHQSGIALSSFRLHEREMRRFLSYARSLSLKPQITFRSVPRLFSNSSFKQPQ